MAQNIKNNPYNDSYFKALLTHLFGKIFKSQIFTTKVIGDIRNNDSSIKQMNTETKRLFLESLDEVSAIDSDLKI